MGLMDRFRGAMDRLTALPEPAGSMRHEWPEGQPWAALAESEWRPGSSTNSEADNADLLSMAVEKATGVPYRFVLDVHRPGMTVYRIEQRVRVPSKVQSTWFEGELHVPSGVEVPLRVTGAGPEDVEIDWEGYLALPARKEEAERLRAEAGWDRMGAEFERRTKPAEVQRIRAANRTAALTWADLVVSGRLSRAQFDQSTQQSLRMGHLLPEDLAEAVAKLDR